MHKETNCVIHALRHGISIAYFTYIQPSPGSILRLPKVAKEICIEQPQLVVLGVLLCISVGVFNNLQNKKLLKPEKIFEDVEKTTREREG